MCKIIHHKLQNSDVILRHYIGENTKYYDLNFTIE
jgi:hypothetical protein